MLPLALAAFLTLLALAAVGHALSIGVRRRRHELAVLRALGLTRRQSRLVIATQASLLALIGLAFGIPLGVALGRTLWRAAADMAPLAYHPPVALWALLLIGPAGPAGREPAGRLARRARRAAAHPARSCAPVGPRHATICAMATIRVALAEDNVLLREGIARLVAATEDFELVGAASDLPELLAVIERCEPDVVVTDIRMPPTGHDEGIQAAAWLREHRPGVGVVVLSQYTAPGYAVALLEHGSAGAPTCSRSGWPASRTWSAPSAPSRTAAR